MATPEEKKDKPKQQPAKPRRKQPKIQNLAGVPGLSAGTSGHKSPKNGNGLAEPLTEHPRHEIQGIVFGALTLLLLVSLFSYQIDDLLPTQTTTQNVAGIIGALGAEFLFGFFGYAAYMFPVLTCLICIDKFMKRPRFVNYGNMLAVIVLILCLCAFMSLPTIEIAPRFAPGGFVGSVVAAFLISYLNVFGAVTVLLAAALTALLLLQRYFLSQFQAAPDQAVTLDPQAPVERVPKIFQPDDKEKAAPPKAPQPRANPLKGLMGSLTRKSAPTPPPELLELVPSPLTGYQLPSPELLNKPPAEKIRAGLKQNLLSNSKIVEAKLLDFGVEGVVVGVLPGPVITRYEFQPAAGVKVSRIVNLSDDLALGLKAVAIRIVAPVPGKDVVGIEVPNQERETVYLRDLIESPAFSKHHSKLVLAVGKDIGGHPYFADLGKMPHLLIAGATGSGKSVCLNGLICSILFHATPDEVRFIMIDPKMLELGVYDGIPHMLIPVVKDPHKASNALNWATEEMTRRYGILAQKGVRNIAQYNEALQEERAQKSGKVEAPLPYIVIIVDELADLMMVASGIEKPITRLAQMARAVGIHLVLATQRPSVDVITGVIKANFPARMSFRVSSKVDSRTILDANGADLLLGDGDMLFLLPGTSHLRRLHGAFVTEKEIKRLTTTIKKMGKPNYDQAVMEYTTAADEKDEDDVEVYRKAVYLVVNSGEASISMLRRALKIGHSKAARLLDTMERDGVVSEFKGSRPREVILTLAQYQERFPQTGA